MGTTVKPASTKASTIRPEGRSMATGGKPAAAQLSEASGIVGDLEVFANGALLVDDAYRVSLAGPIQPGEESAHGQSPASCGMTLRAGSPRGTLTDRRSWLSTLALHPVARLGLPAPRGLRVSCGPSSGQRHWQSPREHGSRITPSAPNLRRVKAAAHHNPAIEHGLPTGCFAAVGNSPPGQGGAGRVAHSQARWITLRHSHTTAFNTPRVVQ